MKTILLAVCLSLVYIASFARGGEDSLSRTIAAEKKLIDSVHATMTYQHGSVALPEGVAKLNIPEGFKFLDAKQSSYVLHDLWGNPERTDVLGMMYLAVRLSLVVTKCGWEAMTCTRLHSAF